VTVDPTPGFLTPRLDEKPLSLGPTELRPAFYRPLLLLQSCGTLPSSPEVDNFRHLNERRYLDACVWVGTDPLIELNYADTVTLDHYCLAPLPGIDRSSSVRNDTSDFVIEILSG
jgi:hypothetical protein